MKYLIQLRLENISHKKEIVMIYKMRPLGTLIIIAMFIIGCADMNYSEEQRKKAGGIGIGAALEYNLIGKDKIYSFPVATNGLAGCLAGKTISTNMDAEDQLRLIRATDEGLRKEPFNTHRDRWANDGRTYETRVTSQNPYIRGSDWQRCKNFTQETTAKIDGRSEFAQQHNTACFDPAKNDWVIEQE